MRIKFANSARIVLALVGAIALLLSAACGGGGSGTTSETGAGLTNAYNINISQKSGIGSFLVDSKGMTLYWTTMDGPNQSNVSGGSLATWPVFNVNSGSFFIPGTLSSFAFDNIVRSDGVNQSTYKGWPMYYYSGDKAAGDTLGQGVGGVWFAVSPTASAPGAK